MMFAVLGNTPELSALELGVPYDGGQIVQLEHCPDLNTLGGTVKIGQVIGNDLKAVLPLLQAVATDHKLVFGFSVYAGDATVTTGKIKDYVKQLSGIGLSWKKQLKADGRSVRFVVSQEPALSSVIVTKEHLLRDQTDIVVMLYADKIVIGRTTAVQDFKKFSDQDFGRPQRDAFSGMLPPKVARMMVNIATSDHTKSILDPFCGSGTVIQEALQLGFSAVVGSDISQKCIDDTKANIQWANLPTPTLICSDVLTLNLPAHSTDVIVAEGYLGPVQPGKVDKIYAEMQRFYEQVFPALAKLLKPHGRLVFALPAWSQPDGLRELQLDQVIRQTGFQAFHKPIYYGRKDAKVVRKIYFLEG